VLADEESYGESVDDQQEQAERQTHPSLRLRSEPDGQGQQRAYSHQSYELPYHSPLHEHNQQTDIGEEVPIWPRCPAKGMLGKQ
jgi:hypothetical protein